ncbi:molybdenum cofactor guanylyltransferase [Virgibacillus phasianinus]|nr:molybdenum cofactor guanylyltransferase [Virgibacillus phasianinus]
MKICSVILAGGHSTRMGTNKALLPLGNKSVIEYIADEMESINSKVVINSNNAAIFSHLGLPIIKDNYLDQGPLAGMEAALSQVDVDICIFSACDTPFVNRQVYYHLLGQLSEYDAVVPVYEDTMHPLSGIYRKRIALRVRKQLAGGERKVRKLFDHINIKFVDEFGDIPPYVLVRHFFNMNNRAQYEKAKWL